MTAISSGAVRLAPAPWRAVGLLALLLALLIIGAMLAAGARPRLPAPFGPAANGRIAYAAHGDIYTADPITGASRAVVTGPEVDVGPVWSRDGQSLLFERMAAGDPGPGWLYMAQADGSGVRRLTPALMADIRTYSVAPDGGEVLVVGIPAATAGSQMAPVMSIVRADGSAMRTVDAGMAVLDAAYRPPDGSRIVFLGVGWYGAPPQREGIYEMNADGTGVRAIVAPSPTSSVGDWSLSPDGARLAYTRSDPASDGTDRQHVVNLDGTADQNVELDPSSAWGNGIWSNDGTRLLVFGLAKNGQDGPFQAVIASPDAGQGRPVQLVVPSGAAQGYDQVEWAPDDRSILVTLRDAADEPLRQVLWDPVSGTFRAVAWETTSAPTWQRLAP